MECNKGFAVLDEGRVLKTKEDILDCSANFFMLLQSIISAKKNSCFHPDCEKRIKLRNIEKLELVNHKSKQSPIRNTFLPLPPATMTALLKLTFLLLISKTLADTPSSQYSTGSDAYQSANLDITSWTGANCAGTAISNTDVQYDYNMEAETLSYNLSRALGPAEQLDWSAPPSGYVARSVDQYCGLYDHTAPAGQGTECVTFERTLTCFRLWHY